MVRAAIVSFPTTQQRQYHRRNLGTLSSNVVKKVTISRYAHYFQKFVQHLTTFTKYWPQDADEYDHLIGEYLELLWDTGEPKTAAAYTLAAIHHYVPSLKRKLPLSWRLKNIWDRLELPCQALPLSEAHMVAISGFFFFRKQYAMAFGCILAFMGLLRTGELLQLRASDCVFTPEGVILHLGETKGAKRKQLIDETVVLHDHLTILLVQHLTSKCHPGDFLLGLSPQKFRTAWNTMRASLKLQEHRFLPYSLRRGGATWYFTATGSFSRTLIKGRWEHLKTCKMYINQAQVALNQISLSPPTQQRLLQLEHDFRSHLHKWISKGRVEGLMRAQG